MLIVANWKMNLLKNQVKEFIDFFNEKEIEKNKKLIICPPSIFCDFINNNNKNSKVYLGSQNCFYQNNGAFTGEISAKMYQDIGCEYVIIGHSERRSIFKENNEFIKRKIIHAHQNNLKVILCVGENLDDYKNKNTLEFIQKQLVESLPSEINNNNILIAYEPIWSIGSGLTPDNEEIQNIHTYIKNYLQNNFNQDFNILYGGSVNINNAEKISNINNVDGLLIGGASLDYQNLFQILKSVGKK